MSRSIRPGLIVLAAFLSGCAGPTAGHPDPDPRETQEDDLAFLEAQTKHRSFWPDWNSRIPDDEAIPPGLLATHVRLGHEARRTFPWAANLDRDTFRRFVLGYRGTTERLVDWRTHFWSDEELRTLVDGYAEGYRKAATDEERDRLFKEMIHAINTDWFSRHMKYAPRGMPDLDPLEGIEQGTGRCTDLTNTLLAILRTYGIAATGVRVVWWPGADGNHTWAAVFDPVTEEWLEVDSGQGGSADDPGYFRKFSAGSGRKPAKMYWVVPGEEQGEVRRAIALRKEETYPPAIEKYLVAKPMVDRTERYGEVADLEFGSVPPETMIWLSVRNSGMWRPIAGARSNGEGKVLFRKVGCGNRYRLMTWTDEMPAYCSEVLILQPGGSVDTEPADPLDEAALLEQRALHFLQKGNLAEAKETLIRAVALRPESPNTLYNLACACSLMGEKEEAIDFLERSIAAGWSNFAHIKTDKDLDPIRGEERFQKLMQGK